MGIVLADAVLIIHVGYLAFLIFGGFLVLCWRWMWWLHLAASVWGLFVLLFRYNCPLTRLEVALRRRAGRGGYTGPFVEHYFEGVLYPAARPVLARTVAILVLVLPYLVLAGRWMPG